LLGILPELPQDLADPEQAAMAAHCVHQIRTLLQIGQRGEDRRSFAITSPAARTGKTSLTLALGVSFAAASSRVLMIDCDIIGGGLTARVETIIRRKIGQILKRDCAITEQQLDTALRLANNSQRKLGEILVELGYLAPEDIDRALAAQQAELPVGMLDALAGEAIEDCVAETGIQGLCILPVGGAAPSDASKLSPQALRSLLARARERFDIVLIDTGPVPGSIEASAVVTAADGLILVVSRGEHRPLVEKSLQYLQDLGARLSGMVFNRAGERDVEAATTTTRLTSVDRTGRTPAAASQEHIDTRFGPVAGAVATSSPASKSGTRPQQP
jgi:Mrp family chromosome partitioning ATPase